MPTSKPFDLNQLFEGSLRRLKTEAEYFSRLTGHNPELGRLNETHLVKLLRDYLPPKFGIGTGFIACGGPDATQSPQCDIVIYDALNNSPLYKSDAWSIYPIEMVYGVIEVKTTLTAETLKDAFDKCGAIRAMARTKNGEPNKSYIRQLPPEERQPVRHVELRSKLAPRFFVFGYRGWNTAEAVETNFKNASEASTHAHVHGVCCLNEADSFYVQHRAFQNGEHRFSPVASNGFRHFLTALPSSLGSMAPDYRDLGFDPVNIQHYQMSAVAPESA